MPDGPSVHRRQLGRWLQSMREERRLTQGQVAQQRHWDTSKISRIETGRVKVHPSDLMILFDLYNVADDHTRQEMLELAERARSETGGFVAANTVRLRPGGFLNFERDATAITVWEPNLVPGLLQTKNYALALHKVGMPKASQKERNARAQLRIDRQKRFDDTNPPIFTAIIDESVLYRQIGGDDTHREQLHQIKDRLAHPTIDLRILPFSVPNNPLPHGPAALLEFSNAPDLNLVYLEGVAGDYYATNQKEFPSYRRMIDTIIKLSLPPAESNRFLDLLISKQASHNEKS